jgi:hypothetical protein
MRLVTKYGEMWARNQANIERIPGSSQGGVGVYILFDGFMPVYVGEGNIRQRIRKARSSKRRGQFWDRFSWYVLRDPILRNDVEALLLGMLPHYPTILNRQKAKLQKAKPEKEDKKNKTPEYISRRPLA